MILIEGIFLRGALLLEYGFDVFNIEQRDHFN
jgi:hypothetical protein